MAEAVTVAILAKAPVPGLAKTRLVPLLGEEGAARLQAAFIDRTLAMAAAAKVGPVALWATPDPPHASLVEAARRHGASLHVQPDADLGERMLTAARSGSPAIVIGTDCPALGPGDLRAAADHLRDGVDVVVQPAEDGGYVLIGLRTPRAEPFADMTWSVPTVMAETRQRIARAGLVVRELRTLWDVDEPADYERLVRSGLL